MWKKKGRLSVETKEVDVKDPLVTPWPATRMDPAPSSPQPPPCAIFSRSCQGEPGALQCQWTLSRVYRILHTRDDLVIG